MLRGLIFSRIQRLRLAGRGSSRSGISDGAVVCRSSFARGPRHGHTQCPAKAKSAGIVRNRASIAQPVNDSRRRKSVPLSSACLAIRADFPLGGGIGNGHRGFLILEVEPDTECGGRVWLRIHSFEPMDVEQVAPASCQSNRAKV